MGLDMYAFKTKSKQTNKEIDFNFEQEREMDTEDLHYWRKHHHLQGWMERLYHEKGGTEEFNDSNTLELKMEDLERLAKDIKEDKLTPTQGFFFGNGDYTEDDKKDDLEFIKEAETAIEEGYKIVYLSSW